MKKTALSYQYSEQHIQQYNELHTQLYVVTLQWLHTHTTVCHHTTMNYMSTTQTQLYVI